ncbi:N-myristoyl transferase, partial [Trachipleistophora hominis]
VHQLTSILLLLLVVIYHRLTAVKFLPMTKEHKFWETQPVAIDASNTNITPLKGVRKTPLDLPFGLRFECAQPSEYRDIYAFLRDNYVEDDVGSFRLTYSYEFLCWEFGGKRTCPDYCVLVKDDHTIIGFVFAKEHDVVINGTKHVLASVNYLCIHKTFRNKNLAPLMITEIQRRVNMRGIACAIFTGALKLPFSICRAQYWHKILDCEYLASCKYINYFVGYKRLTSRRCRRARASDLAEIRRLNNELHTYALYEEFCTEMLACNERIMQFYVIEHDGVLQAFGSFYFLSSLAVKNEKEIKGAYLMHLVGPAKQELLAEMIDVACEQGAHVFNALAIANREGMFEDLKFLRGTGWLNYYFFNYSTLPMTSGEVSMVLF